MKSITQITKPQKAGTMNKLAKYLNAAVLGALIVIEGTSKASAAVIYSQTFNGGPGGLATTTPTTGAGTWTGDNIISRNGELDGGWGAISLAFTPTSGLLYELTATISSQYWGSWIGVGFLPDNSLYGWSPNNPVVLRTETGWGTPPQAGIASMLSNDVLIRLDTTASQWTAAFFQGGTQIGTTYTYATNPTINRVGFVSDGSGGTVSAFSLTTVSNSPTFATWATTNAGGQNANLDWDNDGVPNGVEFFMNAAPGFTVNSGPVDNTVTWINGGNIPSSAYGTAFVVQSSVDLVTWTDVPGNDPNLVNTSNSVAYTFSVSGAGKQFVRLKVTLN